MNHPGCSCIFNKTVEVKASRVADLDKNKTYKAEVWTTPGGTDYLRVNHLDRSDVYLKLSMEDVDEVIDLSDDRLENYN